MKVSERTIRRLARHATGDLELTRYRTGSQLVDLFNNFGFDEVYGQGFPTRAVFAEEKLQDVNRKPELRAFIERIFDPLEFRDVTKDPQAAIDDFNAHLKRDGFEIALTGDGRAKVLSCSGQTVDFQSPPTYTPLSQEFVVEHLNKCDRKLVEGDFRGAITNARSLCEEVLCDIERHLDPKAGRYDGDLPKLYKRVRKLLKMEPSDYPANDAVLVLLRGLTTVVDGLAGMSNAFGDRHGGGSVSAKAHHARLAVNAANTVCTFVVASLVHQTRSG